MGSRRSLNSSSMWSARSLNNSMLSVSTGGASGRSVASEATEVAPPRPSGAQIDGPASDRSGPASRYDPKSIGRVVDINDLVDEIESSGRTFERAEDAIGTTRKTNVPKFWVRAITVAAAACFALGAVAGVQLLVKAVEDDSMHALRHDHDAGREQQRLLEIAELVALACGGDDLDGDASASDCRRLCEARMCCFEEGEGSCADEEGEDCVVYVGCEALLPEYEMGVMYARREISTDIGP